MSVQVPEGQPAQQQQTAPVQNPQQQDQQQQQRSPYADYLDKVPEGLRPTVEPAFKEWDANVTKMQQGLQQQLSGYEPYKELFDQYEPEGLQQAVQFAEQLSTREGTEGLFRQMAEVLGYQIGDEGPDPEGDFGQGGQQFDLSKDPAFNALQEQIGKLAEGFQQQTQSQQESQMIEQAEAEFSQLKQQTFGDREVGEEVENAILQMAVGNGGDLQAAFAQFQKIAGQQAQQLNTPGQQAPIIGGGAANTMPSNVPDIAQMDDKAKRALAVSILNHANAQP